MGLDNKGRSSGLIFIILLLAIVIVALLIVSQMGGLGMGKASDPAGPQGEAAVEQAQEAVDAINERIQQQYGSYGEEP